LSGRRVEEVIDLLVFGEQIFNALTHRGIAPADAVQKSAARGGRKLESFQEKVARNGRLGFGAAFHQVAGGRFTAQV
jgi:hypothetical protein